jgi:hypothetical protein
MRGGRERLYVEVVIAVKVVEWSDYNYRLDPGRVLSFSLVSRVNYSLPNW